MASFKFNLGSFSIKSTWSQGDTYYDSSSGSYICDYVTTPTTGYSTRTVNASHIPQGAKIISVSLNSDYYMSYSTSYLNDNDLTQYIQNSNSTSATNANLKKWLENMNGNYTDFGIIFQVKAGSGQYSQTTTVSMSHSITATYTEAYIIVEYEYPNDRPDETISFPNGTTLNYHFDKKGLLAGETTQGTYLVLGPSTGFKVDYKPTGFGDFTNGGEFIVTTNNNASVIKRSNLGYSDYSTFPQRATEMLVRFTIYLTADKTSYQQTDWLNSGVYFLKERVSPVIEYTVTDTAGHLEKYGKPIQTLSELHYLFTPTTDPYSEAKITSIVASWDNVDSVLTNGEYILHTESISPDIEKYLTITATDSFEMTSTIILPLTSYIYTAPKIELFKVSRYELQDGAPVFAGAGEKGALSLKTSTSSLGGQNTYRVSFSDGTVSTVLYEGVGELNINIINDLEKLASYVFALDQTYNCSITITDDMNEVIRFNTVRKSGAILLQVESYGIGIGTIPSGTVESPTFDCAFPAVITNAASFSDARGIDSLNLEGTEYKIQMGTSTDAAEGFITIIIE